MVKEEPGEVEMLMTEEENVLEMPNNALTETSQVPNQQLHHEDSNQQINEESSDENISNDEDGSDYEESPEDIKPPFVDKTSPQKSEPSDASFDTTPCQLETAGSSSSGTTDRSSASDFTRNL